MKPKNPNYAAETWRILSDAPFISDMGIEAVGFEPGSCVTTLTLRPKHLQQDGIVHAAVQAAVADHTAGAAASTLIGADERVLTAEFKINLLRAAKGDRLNCFGKVLKPGSHITVVESEVYCEDSERSVLVSKATVSVAVVKIR